MYQTIVLSPTALSCLNQGITDPKVLDFLKQVQTESLVIDSKNILGKEYQCVIENSRNADLLKVLWADLISRIHFYHHDVGISVRRFEEINNLEIEIELANHTIWKIIIAEINIDKNLDTILRNHQIEACNVQAYLCPPWTSKVRAEEHYDLLPGSYFNFRQWLTKYLLDAEYLEIADGYIGTKFAFLDLKFILSIIRSSVPVTILTLSDNARHYSRNQSSSPTDDLLIEDLLVELQKEYPKLEWILYDKKYNLETRWIKTDRFIIVPEKGLGFVNRENNKVMKQTSITVRHI